MTSENLIRMHTSFPDQDFELVDFSDKQSQMTCFDIKDSVEVNRLLVAIYSIQVIL